ncbi:zinc metalloproteinase-disintegrin-like MTP4 isoform X2 [Eleutherodactylus coqui]|uniref:zinc metalloproteinase-disintegrin-like MTP4 isoform X2 n=1 Tax=Eleutherodactylus coqui TaxID=57060 RepID=UPI003463423B
MLLAALFLLVLLSVQSEGFNEIPAGQKYQVVFLQKIHAHHKRDTQSEYPDVVQYGLEVDGQPMVLHLEKTEDLLSENYTETHYLTDGSPVTTSPEIKDHCFYQGYVKNDNSSQVTLSACNGLSGIIETKENKFLIQPLNTSETGAHAVYQYQSQETPKTCGVDDTMINETIMTKTDFSSSNQEKETFLRSRKYIEMYVVADNSMFRKFNGREDDIRRRIFGIVNFVNQVYKPLNLFVALTGMEIWSNGNQFQVVTSANTNLQRFSEWREKQLLSRKPHDNAQFLTNMDFDGSTIGLAWISTLCSNTHSAAVIQDHSEDYIPVAATLAHEMGHNLGMNHDDHCSCRASSCIMAGSLSHITPRTFSSCSHQDYQNFILGSMPLCMKNKPNMGEIISTPVCGNKFTERGEECDCGSVQECADKCCDAATCKLKQGAQCSEGECCSNCQLKSAGSVCRPAKDECDLTDFCDGRSATCPSDSLRMNGSPCKNGEGYCYQGKCPTLRSQCETYWGAGSVPAETSCYSSIRNYCRQSGYRQCGALYCSRGSSRPVVNIGYCGYSDCKVLDPEVLVESGTKCGNGTMCINGQCAAIPTRIQSAECAAKCPGNSVCDNELRCHCEEGWAPPNCDSKIDSSSSGLIALVVIIIIILIILVVVALVLYKRSQRKKQRPAGLESGVTNPTFNIQNQTRQQPTSYANPQPYPGRPMYTPQPPAQSQKPQMYYAPYLPAQGQKPQFSHANQQPASVPPSRPLYPPVPSQAAKPNYRR